MANEIRAWPGPLGPPGDLHDERSTDPSARRAAAASNGDAESEQAAPTERRIAHAVGDSPGQQVVGAMVGAATSLGGVSVSVGVGVTAAVAVGVAVAVAVTVSVSVSVSVSVAVAVTVAVLVSAAVLGRGLWARAA